MRSKKYIVIIEKDEDNRLIASVPALKGCHTQAKDLTTLMKRIKEAVRLCEKVEKRLPAPLEFVGIQEIAA